MLELYTGEGKGKTTASVGLAVRAAGRDIPVCFAQFLKDGSSGEIRILKTLPTVTVKLADAFYGFTFRMTEEEKVLQRASFRRLLAEVREWMRELTSGEETGVREAGKRGPEGEIRGLVILDELLSAVSGGMVEEEEALAFLKEVPQEVECVFTGRGATDRLAAKADYISRIACEKHPYKRGISAREGVEY